MGSNDGEWKIYLVAILLGLIISFSSEGLLRILSVLYILLGLFGFIDILIINKRVRILRNVVVSPAIYIISIVFVILLFRIILSQTFIHNVSEKIYFLNNLFYEPKLGDFDTDDRTALLIGAVSGIFLYSLRNFVGPLKDRYTLYQNPSKIDPDEAVVIDEETRKILSKDSDDLSRRDRILISLRFQSSPLGPGEYSFSSYLTSLAYDCFYSLIRSMKMSMLFILLMVVFAPFIINFLSVHIDGSYVAIIDIVTTALATVTAYIIFSIILNPLINT